MTKRYSFHDLIIGHLDSLLLKNPKKFIYRDTIFFFLFPLIFSIIFLNSSISDIGLALLVSIMSILTGFLFTLLSSIFSAIEKTDSSNSYDDTRELFIETYNNVGFGILTSVSNIVVCAILGTVRFKETLVFTFLDGINLDTDLINLVSSRIANGLIFYLFAMFCLTLFIILQRMQSIFMRSGYLTSSQRKKYPD
jgi:hypothetical protein